MKRSVNLSSSFKLSTLAMVLVVGQGVLLSGCSSHSAMMVKQVEQQSSDQQRIQQVMEALQITEARLAQAQAENAELYAPHDMDEAKAALGEARRYSDRIQADPKNVNESISLFFGETMGEKTLALISTANDALGRAEANKKQAETIFADANENFLWLKKFEAPVHFRYEYQDLERTQRRLVEYLADGRADKARDGLPRLLKEQRALETAAAQRYYLFEISQKVEWQAHSNLNRYASISYSGAVGVLNKAKNVIAQDTRNEEAILVAKAEAEFYFEVAGAVAADMQKLSKMDRNEMERWLMLLTTKLNEAAKVMGADDVRNRELMQQMDLLTAAAKQQAEQAEPQVTVEEASAEVAKPVQAQAPQKAISDRITELENTLSQQVQALMEQLNAMKAANKTAQAAVEETPAP